MADIPGNTSTTSVLTGTGVYTSTLATSGDSDWWRVKTVAGRRYDFTLSGDGSASSLDDVDFYIKDANGNTITSNYSSSGGPINLSFTAGAGPYYIVVSDGFSDGLAEGNYVINAHMSDTLPNDNSTTASLTNGSRSGSLETAGDGDRYRVQLTAGQRVDFVLSGDGSANSLDDADFYLLDQNGNTITSNYTSSGGPISLAATATYTGAYYVVVKDGFDDSAAEGNFRIESRLTDRVVGDAGTTATIKDGTMLAGQIDARGDADWVRFAAVAGRTYSFTMAGDGSASSLVGKELVLRDANGSQISTAYTYGSGSVTITWKAAGSGPVYLDAHGNTSSDWGNYRLSVVSDAPVLTGTSGNDNLTGGSDDTRMLGLAGDDTLNGGGGNDTLNGGAGNDVFIGGDGLDVVELTGSADTRASLGSSSAQNTGYGADRFFAIEGLVGGTGRDRFVGTGAANWLDGRDGNDSLYGGAGNDTLLGGEGNDLLSGSTGTDTIVFRTTASLNVSLVSNRATGEGTDTLSGIENVTAGSGNDRLTGDARANALNGGAGNDAIDGGQGRDALTGGSGADRFVFHDGDSIDTITDFADRSDRIVIDGSAHSYADLAIRDSSAGAVVSWGEGTAIIVTGVDAAHLTASDFLFV